MGEIRRIDMPLDAEIGDEIGDAIAAGDYPDVPSVVEAALQSWCGDRILDRLGTARVRELIEEGLASGAPVPMTEDWFEDVKRRGKARLAEMRRTE